MQKWKKRLACVLAGSMVLGSVYAGSGTVAVTNENTAQAATEKRTLTIDGNTMVTTEQTAFRGLGAVTCNNSSRLLMDYKEENEGAYWEIMNWLFNKDTGAGLSHIKIELGCDLDTSSGAEPATKRLAEEKANVKRGAGYMFAHDALTINPDITVDMLCWGMPAWVENAYDKSDAAGNKARYRWYKETIDAAYDEWGITFSYVGANRNEKYMERDWTVYLRNALDNEEDQRYDYEQIKIVAADETDKMEAAAMMLEDKEYRDAVDVLGFHYNSYMDENVKKLHDEYGKEVWFSEGASVATDTIFGVNNTTDGVNTSGTNGMLDIANRIIIGMAQSNMTMYEFQPAVASYYDGSVYFPKQLVKANSPWSGDYAISNGLIMAMHFTNFMEKGWKFVDSGSYGDGTQSEHCISKTTDNYLTAAEGTTGDYSTVITNDSDTARVYQVEVSNLEKAASEVAVWETKSNSIGEAYDAHWLKKIDTLTPEKKGDVYTYKIEVKPYSMVTLTTTTGQQEYTARKEQSSVGKEKDTKLALPYTDDYEYSDEYLERRGNTPRFTSDVNGAFEVEVQENGNKILRQQINQDLLGSGWGLAPENAMTSFGDDTWKDYMVSADVMLDPDENAKNYAGICARYNVVDSIAGNGYELRIFRQGKWTLLSNQGKIAEGTIAGMREGRVVNLKLKVLGNTVTAYINNEQVVKKTVKKSMANSGRVALVSSFHRNSFDNIKVEPIQGGITHITRVDDLNSDVKFTKDVIRQQSQSYRYLGRTVSVLKKKDDTFSYTFTGTGGSFLGNNLLGAEIKVTVDGKVVEEKYAIKATEHRSAFYQITGLEMGSHTVEISLLNDRSLYVDAIEVEGEGYQSDVVAAEGVSVEQETLALAYGERVSLGTKVEPANATESVVYTTSDMAVATVTSDGMVVGNGAGTAIVTATLSNGKTATTKVTVTELAITPRSGIRVGVGEKVKLKASYIKRINKGSIKEWISSDTELAMVSGKGVVTTKKEGYVTISAVGDNGYIGKVVIHIRTAPYRLRLIEKSMTVKVGKLKKLRFEVPKGCYSAGTTFKSSKPSVATVSKNGEVTGKKKGTCKITIKTYNGKKKVVKIKVKKK